MAQFRGTIRGHRGEASRLGGKESGLVVKGHGWKGGASIWLHTVGDEDRMRVELEAHPSEGGYTFTLYDGPATVEAFKAWAERPECNNPLHDPEDGDDTDCPACEGCGCEECDGSGLIASAR